jgi:hypothetical protein
MTNEIAMTCGDDVDIQHTPINETLEINRNDDA